MKDAADSKIHSKKHNQQVDGAKSVQNTDSSQIASNPIWTEDTISNKKRDQMYGLFLFFVVHRMGNKTYPKNDALSTVRFQFKTCCSKKLSYNIKNVCMRRILRYKGMSLKLYDK